MLISYLCVRGFYVGHVFVCEGYICWSCICVLGVSMLVMYLCARGIDVVIYLCVSGIDAGHVFVC